METIKSKRVRFIIGCVVVFGIAAYNNTDFAQRNQIHYGSLQLGKTVSFEAPTPGERIAIALKTKTAQDLLYTVTGPDGKEIIARADTVKSKHRGFFFRVEQPGTHTLKADYDCSNCSPGIGFATVDIHKSQTGEFMHAKNQSGQ